MPERVHHPELIDKDWGWVTDTARHDLATTGTVHLADCRAFNPHTILRPIEPQDVPIICRCDNCVRRLAGRIRRGAV